MALSICDKENYKLLFNNHDISESNLDLVALYLIGSDGWIRYVQSFGHRVCFFLFSRN